MNSEQVVPPTIETIFRQGQNVAGKYCLDHPIAAGDRGEVWAALDLRTRKRIALRVVLHPFGATPDERERFRHEVLAASCIIHPNLVTVFDVVDHAAKTCIAMELLRGQDLGTYLARQRLPTVEETVALLVPAMRAMAAANARGVFHRALTPKSIFLCIGPDGRPTITKVLNLGISPVAVNATQQRSKTVLFIPRRTRAYTSLNEAKGASSSIDERPDVYGFGVTLFEALAGQPPHVGAAGAELLMRIAQEPVPKLTRFRPDLHPEMDEIIARATARNPNDRFPTLDDFIAALLWEQVLPPSPMLRRAREVVDVPFPASGSGPTRLTDPVAGVAQRSTPAEQPDPGITRVLLYALSRADAEKQEQSDQVLLLPQISSRQQPNPQLRTDRPWSAKPLRRGKDTRRLVRAVRGSARLRGVLAVTAIAGAAAVAAWFVIPTRPQHPQGGGQSGAVMAPVSPGKSQPVAPPPREVAELTAQSKPFAVDEELPANVPSALHPHSEDRRRAAHPTFRPTEPSVSSPPAENLHRAGQLSAEDF